MLVWVFVYVYVFERECVCVCACVRSFVYIQTHTQAHTSTHTHTCTHARTLVSRASRIYPRMRMRVRKWAGGGKEKYVWADLPGFHGSSSRF